MERELAANNQELAAAAHGFDEAGHEAGDFGKGLGDAGRETDQFGRALGNADKGLSDAEKSTSKLGDSLSDAEKELGATGKETDSLGREMEDTTKKTSVFGDVLKANLAADAIKAGAKALVDMVREVGAVVKSYVSDGSRLASECVENQAKLAQVMRNTMDASDAEIASIVGLFHGVTPPCALIICDRAHGDKCANEK
jgi:ABC-type transporter Mla subunit MlaD